MSISIIAEPNIVLSREDYERYRAEYYQAHNMYAGIAPSFDVWLRNKLR